MDRIHPTPRLLTLAFAVWSALTILALIVDSDVVLGVAMLLLGSLLIFSVLKLRHALRREPAPRPAWSHGLRSFAIQALLMGGGVVSLVLGLVVLFGSFFVR